MKLHELHIAKRCPVPIGQRHTITGYDTAVGILTEYPAGSAGAEDHRVGLYEGELTGGDFNYHHALTATILDNDVDTKVFVEAFNGRVFDGSLKQGM